MSTLQQAIQQANTSQISEVLLRKGKTFDEVRELLFTMQAASRIAGQLVKVHPKAKVKGTDPKQKEIEEKREKVVQAGIDIAKEMFLNTLLANDIPESIAIKLAEKQFTKSKVQVRYNNKIFETSAKGKISRELQDALDYSGLSRKEFIANYSI
jgi:hypothetical protein